MRTLVLILGITLTGCASGVVYKRTPQTPVDSRSSALVNGAVLPYGVYFTAVSQYENNYARTVVLSYMGTKLLDLGVTPDKIEVYYKVPQLPARMAAGFGRFVRAKLFTACPEEKITYYDTKTRADFEAQSRGGVQCL